MCWGMCRGVYYAIHIGLTACTERDAPLVEFVGKVLGINKLVEYGASGLGAIAGSVIANWKADREGRARLTAARYDAEVRELEAGTTAKSVEIIAVEPARTRETMDVAMESGPGKLQISRHTRECCRRTWRQSRR